MTIRALLVDDHALFRQGVAGVLGADPGLKMDQCGSIREALQILAGHTYDIVLLDHDLGSERASQFLPAARQIGFDGRVLVVTAWVSDTEARRLLRQGVSGIFLKSGELSELAQSIRTVAAGGTWLDRSFTAIGEEASAEPQAAPTFNERQRRVLRFVLEGLSNKEIAWRLQISESYVKAILQSLFQKTGVRTRGQLVRVAVEQYADQL
ncbi:MAG TPA: response regulator transcription factor [Candidatus Acidoferrales bacterium]|nr:response regulator transcription factor [Candidatus Acidoferrales bacterium]